MTYTRSYLPFSDNDLKLIEEAVARVMGETRHPAVSRIHVRQAVAAELCNGAPVMFRLVKAGRMACDAAFADKRASNRG